MAANNINISIDAVDKTSKTFDKISQKSKGLSGSMTNMGKSISSAFGKFLAIGAVVGSIKAIGNKLADLSAEYANLTDSAMQAGISSASSLQGLVKTLDLVGLKGMTVDNVAKAFNRMTKATGATDISGFISELQRISQLETEQERLNESIRVFGKEAGASFAVVARGGDEAINAIANMTGQWSTCSDEQINAFAEIDGAWTRICDDMEMAQANMLASIMGNLIGTTEITEQNLMLLYEKIKMIFKVVGKAIVDPFKAAFGAVATAYYAFIGVIADGVAWVVDIFDEELAAKIDAWSTKQYDAAMEWVDYTAEIGEEMMDIYTGTIPDDIKSSYEANVAKWNDIFTEKAKFDNAVGENAFDAPAAALEDAAGELSKSADKLDKSIKTTGWIGAGTAESLKIITLSNAGNGGIASSVAVGHQFKSLTAEQKRTNDIAMQILAEIKTESYGVV